MKLFPIVLNWNDAVRTVACVRSLIDRGLLPDDVTVVDNASTDGSVDYIRTAVPGIRLLCTESNLGFAGGMNVGARAVLERNDDDDVVLFLNNDAVVQTDLTALVEALKCGAIGLASPLIAHHGKAGGIQFQGGDFDIQRGDVTWYGEKDRQIHQQGDVIESPRLIGTALAARVGTLKQIGLFDESFFLYFEDDELSLRSLLAGYRNVVVPAVKVAHTGKSRHDAPAHYFYYMRRNEYLLWRTVMSRRTWAVRRLSLLTEALCNLHERRSEPQIKQAMLDGLWGALTDTRGQWQQGSCPRWFAALVSVPLPLAHLLRILTKCRRRIAKFQSRADAREKIASVAV